MFNWLSGNKTGLALLLAAALLAGILFAASGCVFDDIVQVNVPKQVQDTLGVPARVPLSQAPDITEKYHQVIDRQAVKLADENAAWAQEQQQDLERRVTKIELEAKDRDFKLVSFKSESQRGVNALAAAVQHGAEVRDFLGGLINTGIGVAQHAAGASGLAALPGGALLLAGLTGVGGLFLRKPGTQAELDKTYDAAQEDLLKRLREAGQIAPGFTLPPRDAPRA